MHACPNCRRHIRESECPFCHAVHDVPPPPSGPGIQVGLRRSALIATVVISAGCATNSMYGIPDSYVPTDATADSSDASASPAYGLPVDAGSE